jgi:hypothetical protein
VYESGKGVARAPVWALTLSLLSKWLSQRERQIERWWFVWIKSRATVMPLAYKRAWQILSFDTYQIAAAAVAVAASPLAWRGDRPKVFCTAHMHALFYYCRRTHWCSRHDDLSIYKLFNKLKKRAVPVTMTLSMGNKALVSQAVVCSEINMLTPRPKGAGVSETWWSLAFAHSGSYLDASHAHLQIEPLLLSALNMKHDFLARMPLKIN